MYICEVCGTSFVSKFNFKRHFNNKHINPKSNKTKLNLKNEKIVKVDNIEETPSCSYIRCETCKLNIRKGSWSHHLRTNEHKKK